MHQEGDTMKKLYILLLTLFLMTPLTVSASTLGTKSNPVKTRAQLEQVLAYHVKNKTPRFTVYKTMQLSNYSMRTTYVKLFKDLLLNGKYGIDSDYAVSDFEGIEVDIKQGTTMYFHIDWETSAQQEKIVNKGVKKIYKKLKLKKKKSRYKKVKAIYDYMVKKVKYDDSCRWSSAYYAVKKRKTSCEGYAELFYKLCKKAKIPCHIICGDTYKRGWNEPHEWNIVKIKGKWYQVDCTWDASFKRGKTSRKYFLKARLPYHTFDLLDPENHIKDALATKNLSKYKLAKKNYKH